MVTLGYAKVAANDFENPSELWPILAGSLLLLIGFLLWLLSASLPTSRLLIVSEFTESPRARKNRREFGYGARRSREVRRLQRSAEKAGATEGIQSAEGGTALWEARARKQLWTNF